MAYLVTPENHDKLTKLDDDLLNDIYLISCNVILQTYTCWVLKDVRKYGGSFVSLSSYRA